MPKISANGVSLNYELCGQGNNEPMVLLHEIGGTLQSWSAMTPEFSKHSCVLAYDQRGCGESDKIHGDFALDTHISDLHALLAALDIRRPVHLAGVAIGSALVVRYATTYPKQVKSLVLACPALSVSEDRKAYLAKRAAAVAAEGMGATIDNTLSLSYPPEVLRDRAVYDRYRARFLKNDPQSYAAINLAFAKFDATPDLAALTCPVLVLAGLHDRLRPPAHARAVADRIKDAKYREIDSGHLMPVQAPVAMAAAMADYYKEII